MDRATLVERILSKYPDMQPDLAGELADRAIEYFCALSKRAVVPARAGWLLVDIAVAFAQQGTAGMATEASDAPVSSIKRGDTTIQYDTASGSAASIYSFGALDARIRRFAIVRTK